MSLSEINDRGLVLLGCGKMGSALLEGWLARGVPPAAVWVIDPAPGPRLEELAAQGLHLGGPLPAAPAVVLLAVKPQLMAEALPQVAGSGGGGTLFVSIAAGTALSWFEARLGAATPIVRAMPNTPAAIGRGITALIGNAAAGAGDMALAEALLAAVGETVLLENEDQIDAVTALSGGGPAYVFHLIECMTEAGVAAGLAPDMALRLARATVAGAGALAAQADESPGQLRINVTSPGGTTAEALKVLMDPEAGLPPLMTRAIAAATARARELKG